MRIFVVVFAALLTLGLVAFGVIVGQKVTDPVTLTAAAARVSSSQNTVAAAKSDKVCILRGTLCTDRSRAEQHEGSSAGFSSSRAGAEAICCVQLSRGARALTSH